MKARVGVLALMASAALVAGGCASGSGSGGGSGPAPAVDEAGNPIPTSQRPREDNFTQSAQLYLTQADMAGDEAGMVERYSLAAEAAQNAVNSDEGNPLAYLLLGQAQVGTGDYEAADASLQKAVEIYYPFTREVEAIRENAWVDLYNQGIGALNQGDTDQALEAFAQADRIFRGRPEAMLQMGALYSNRGEFDAAASSFQDALDLIRNTDYATADSARVEGWDELEVQATRFLGQVLTQAERFEDAADVYESYLEAHPNDLTIMSQLAMVTMASGDTVAADAMYEELLENPDVTLGGLYDVGVGLFQGGLYAASARAFEKVIEGAPQHRDALFNYVTALYQSDQWEAVIESSEALREMDPKNELAYQYAAFAYAQSGDSDTGIALQAEGQNLNFKIDNTRLQPSSSGGATITGQLINNTLPEGTPVELRIGFVAEDGSIAGSVDVTVVAPESEMAEVFRADFDSDQLIIGFFYEVLSEG